MLRHTTRTILLATLLLLVFGADAEAQWQRNTSRTDRFRFRLGLFEPAGGSDGWDAVFEGFTGQPSDLQDFVWGIDYLWRTGRHTAVLFGFSYYGGATTSALRRLGRRRRQRDSPHHQLETSGSDRRVSLSFRQCCRPPLSRDRWRLRVVATRPTRGISSTSAPPDQPVIWAWYGADGATFEAFALAGIDIPINPRWSIFVEGRYRYATDELGDDFSGFGELDLSGYELTAGFGVNF